ncbi:MAG: homocysteine S-methyltransferase family protein [Alphaproteobacteria bacterium]|nr:homocysteine S-methyltransferase family protein [Alphaproteobacteria bacterium]MCB9929482.1 homocysteine S-methyltransferase family protein [Alphaproteobacteria bacterium]
MTKYRNRLPQLNGKSMLTDGGLETTLVFHQEMDIPCFAAITVLRLQCGERIIREYFRPYVDIALASGRGLILGTPTWRASSDWAQELGYTPREMEAAHHRSVALLAAIRDTHETPDSPFVISGDIGPRGDGYVPGALMTAAEAAAYHRPQIETLAAAGADLVTALTLNYADEAIGVAEAARDAGMPVAISFTVETDGRLPTGQSLADAIAQVDAETGAAPAYYMINCAHPTHFADAVAAGEAWTRRIRGLRANASCLSHAELEACTELDEGNPVELGRQYRALQDTLPALRVFGGCCGTDHRHVAEISRQIAA